MFQDKFYLQLRGTAMGANMAPTYANIYATGLEDKFVYVSHHAQHLMAWWRYIVDIFIIWTSTESNLHEFHNSLNYMDHDIQFTLNFSTKSIQFLQTEVSLVDNHLTTKIYVKPTMIFTRNASSFRFQLTLFIGRYGLELKKKLK